MIHYDIVSILVYFISFIIEKVKYLRVGKREHHFIGAERKETWPQSAFPFRRRADRTVLERCLVGKVTGQGLTLTSFAGLLLGALGDSLHTAAGP